MKKTPLKTEIFNYIMITIGACIAAFGIEDFLAPNKIYDGGIVGVSMIISTFSGLKLSILTWVLNVPFLILGYKKRGRDFVIRSVYAMTVFSIAVAVLPDPTP